MKFVACILSHNSYQTKSATTPVILNPRERLRPDQPEAVIQGAGPGGVGRARRCVGDSDGGGGGHARLLGDQVDAEMIGDGGGQGVV